MKYFVHYSGSELINEAKKYSNFSTFSGMATGELENLLSLKFPIQSRDYNYDTITNLPKNCANDLIFDEKPNLNDLKGKIKQEINLPTQVKSEVTPDKLFYFEFYINVKPFQSQYFYEICSNFNNWNLSKDKFDLLMSGEETLIKICFGNLKTKKKCDYLYHGRLEMLQLQNLIVVFELNGWNLDELEKYLIKKKLCSKIEVTIEISKKTDKNQNLLCQPNQSQQNTYKVISYALSISKTVMSEPGPRVGG